MKKILAILMVCVMALGMVACGGKEEPAAEAPAATEEAAKEEAPAATEEAAKDGFVIGMSNGYWGNTWRAQMVADFEGRAEEYKAEGIIADYIVSNTENDATEQLNQINAMLDKGVDAILIDAVSPTTIQSAVDRALEEGVLVIVSNDPAAYEGTICVCGNNYSWEQILATWVCEKTGGKGDIVKITGVSGNAADTLRQNADDDVLAKYPDINVIASAPGNWSQTDAQSVMTTFLSSYDKIDAVLAQDVMAEGIVKAYDNAGKEYPIMTGDYTHSFLQTWKEKGLDTIAASYDPGVLVTCLDVAVNLLQGKEIDESKFEPNPMDETLVNALMVDPHYVVTNEGEQDAPWLEGLQGTVALSIDEALEVMEGKESTAGLDGFMTREEVLEAFFK